MAEEDPREAGEGSRESQLDFESEALESKKHRNCLLRDYVEYKEKTYTPTIMPRLNVETLFKTMEKQGAHSFVQLTDENDESYRYDEFSFESKKIRFFPKIQSLNLIQYLQYLQDQEKGKVRMYNNVIFYNGGGTLLDDVLSESLKQLSRFHEVEYILCKSIKYL